MTMASAVTVGLILLHWVSSMAIAQPACDIQGELDAERTGVSAMLARDVAAGRWSMAHEDAHEERRRTSSSDSVDTGIASAGRFENFADPAKIVPKAESQSHAKSEPSALSKNSLGKRSLREKAAALLAGMWTRIDDTWASSAPQWLQATWQIKKFHVVQFLAAGLVLLGILCTTMLAQHCRNRCEKPLSVASPQGNMKHSPFDWRFWSSKSKDPELERNNVMLLMPVIWGQVTSVR
mmetsp:Transcript_44846/g.86270  ORF Transcript_44846/g.86270 Transcript_44846/m.86270 type:complete len:237 (+) Transcript_44846:69-779(+)